MSDLVTRIWSGPFEAHDSAGRPVAIGDPIEVTPAQAKENPGWFAAAKPVHHKPDVKAEP